MASLVRYSRPSAAGSASRASPTSGAVGEWTDAEPLTPAEAEATSVFVTALEGAIARALRRRRRGLEELEAARFGHVILEFKLQDGRFVSWHVEIGTQERG